MIGENDNLLLVIRLQLNMICLVATSDLMKTYVSLFNKNK
jgi:hypothetical protein